MKPNLRLETWYRLQARFNLSPGVRASGASPRLNITLTTVPRRLKRLHLSLASLLHQRLKPYRILLWIGEESVAHLPWQVDRLRCRGLDIRARPDVGPHTKLIYALREFPDDINVTADDDRLYPCWWLDRLYSSYLRNPSAIHCHRAHGMGFDSAGALLPYRNWRLLSRGEQGPSMILFPTGTGGVLYPPRCLHSEVFNVEVMRRICSCADDVWFKAMSMLNGVSVRKVDPEFREFPSVSGTQDGRLWNMNIMGNDTQLDAVFSQYDLFRQLTSFAKRRLMKMT